MLILSKAVMSFCDDQLSTIEIEQAMERIRVMCLQEDFIYRPFAPNSDPITSKNKAGSKILFEWRAKLITYYCNVIDYCNFSYESVFISISYLDRFVYGRPNRKSNAQSTKVQETREAALTDCRIYQLLAIACLYIAIKITEIEPLGSNSFVQLSHHTYTQKEIEDMELIVMEALDWYLNPPTPMSFVHQMTCLINQTFTSINNNIATLLFGLASRQVMEICMVECLDNIDVKASDVAQKAVICAYKDLTIRHDAFPSIDTVEGLIHEILSTSISRKVNQPSKSMFAISKCSSTIIHSAVKAAHSESGVFPPSNEKCIIVYEPLFGRKLYSDTPLKSPVR